jgi:hypothetical protein
MEGVERVLADRDPAAGLRRAEVDEAVTKEELLEEQVIALKVSLMQAQREAEDVRSRVAACFAGFQEDVRTGAIRELAEELGLAPQGPGFIGRPPAPVTDEDLGREDWQVHFYLDGHDIWSRHVTGGESSREIAKQGRLPLIVKALRCCLDQAEAEIRLTEALSKLEERAEQLYRYRRALPIDRAIPRARL